MSVPLEQETIEQYIARRTSHDGKQHWNLSVRDLEALRYLLGERDRLKKLLEAQKNKPDTDR